MKFKPFRLAFGKPPPDGFDEADGLPKPLTTKAAARRAAGIREAAEVLALLPQPGESLHCLCTARMDLTDVINALLEQRGRCDRLLIATLGYNARNLRMMLGWIDRGAVGELTLLASLFFRSHNGGLWEQTAEEFGSRK